MMPELEHLIQKRAHEIWEQEGRPHGRHEEHWRQAAEDVTREIERMKADHQAGSSEEAGEAAPKTRQRRTKAAGDAPAPRARKTRAAGSAEAGASPPQEAKPARRRATKPTDGGGAQAEPAAPPARTTRRRAAKAEGS